MLLDYALLLLLWHIMDVFDEMDDMWHFSSPVCLVCLISMLLLGQSNPSFPEKLTPWMTPELLLSIKEKNKAKRCAYKTYSADKIAACKLLLKR